MPTYTMRLTKLNPESTDDFVFLIDGKESGRCYFTRASNNRDLWLWTVYGSSVGGMEDTLEEAQAKFKRATGG
jgi:hypothetical protein